MGNHVAQLPATSTAFASDGEYNPYPIPEAPPPPPPTLYPVDPCEDFFPTAVAGTGSTAGWGAESPPDTEAASSSKCVASYEVAPPQLANSSFWEIVYQRISFTVPSYANSCTLNLDGISNLFVDEFDDPVHSDMNICIVPAGTGNNYADPTTWQVIETFNTADADYSVDIFTYLSDIIAGEGLAVVCADIMNGVAVLAGGKVTLSADYSLSDYTFTLQVEGPNAHGEHAHWSIWQATRTVDLVRTVEEGDILSGFQAHEGTSPLCHDVFGYWSGAFSSYDPTPEDTIEVWGNVTLAANFVAADCKRLDVAMDPSTRGQIVSTPAGINTSTSNWYMFPTDSEVSLQVTPYQGELDHWSGDASGSQNPKVLTMAADKNVTAHLGLREWHWETRLLGSDSGGGWIDDDDDD